MLKVLEHHFFVRFHLFDSVRLNDNSAFSDDAFHRGLVIILQFLFLFFFWRTRHDNHSQILNLFSKLKVNRYLFFRVVKPWLGYCFDKDLKFGVAKLKKAGIELRFRDLSGVLNICVGHRVLFVEELNNCSLKDIHYKLVGFVSKLRRNFNFSNLPKPFEPARGVEFLVVQAKCLRAVFQGLAYGEILTPLDWPTTRRKDVDIKLNSIYFFSLCFVKLLHQFLTLLHVGEHLSDLSNDVSSTLDLE